MTMKIKIDLFSLSSWANARKQIYSYRQKLPWKCERLCERLASIGRTTATVTFSNAVYDVFREKDGSETYGSAKIIVDAHQVSMERDSGGSSSWVITANGEEVAFVEFGAGVYFNSGGSAHENRPDGIVGIGQYGKGYGKKKLWGFTDETGRHRLTRGTPEQPGMLLASRDMRQQLIQVASEVFND